MDPFGYYAEGIQQGLDDAFKTRNTGGGGPASPYGGATPPEGSPFAGPRPGPAAAPAPGPAAGAPATPAEAAAVPSEPPAAGAALLSLLIFIFTRAAILPSKRRACA